ncbi:MAG: tRNA (N6-isopentenyl adenosine(37)-C2)-methylthiotransferase MiaB [bacterium]
MMSKESKSRVYTEQSRSAPKKFYIKTFGCQMNKNDSSIITEILENNNYRSIEDPVRADIYIINTCSVRKHAEQRALGHISSLKKWADKPDRKVVVVGCMAQRIADNIIRQYAFVDLVLGPDSYRNISKFLDEIYKNQTRISDTKLSGEVYDKIYPKRTGIVDFISIMRGCDNFCSYCIVPYVRGRVRSRPVDDIIAQINHLIENGVKDITLLGQNVNEYAHRGIDFAGLLNKVVEIPGLIRLRFLTSHPKDLNDEIIHTVAKHDNLCEWFHLPLQSGCDRILQLMNRQYNKSDYHQLVGKIRQMIPQATITTDIIVGFPTETEKEFEETVDMLHEMRFDDAYMYRYSARQGTKAFQYESLPERMIMTRLKKIIDIQSEIVKKKAKKMINRTYEVLFEGPAANRATRGKTRGNNDIIVEQEIKPGFLGKVIIIGVKGRTPIAELIE